VERVGVSFEPELLSRFDNLIKRKGYNNRSEAIRDLVRKSIIESDIESEKGEVIGTLTIIYDHDVGDITNKLLHTQHHHHSEISSTTHIHVDEHNCLEVLVVRGKAGSVIRLADNIKAIKGVKHGELVITKIPIGHPS
jgi:CopG family nickel-responsive transcriptional regulator